MNRDLRLGNGRPTCLVVDDHPAVVDAVSAYLERHGISVIAHAREGQEALAKIEDERPDIALIDLALPGLHGIEVIRRAKRTTPKTTAIVYTGQADKPAAADALDAGARGLVLKTSPLPDLVRVVEAVAAGGIYVDAALTGAVSSGGQPAKPVLSRREREVLRLLSHGLTNAEIGDEIDISPETVRIYVRRAIAKLASKSRTQAVATALRQGLIA